MLYSLSGTPSKGKPGAYRKIQVRLIIEEEDLGKEYLLSFEVMPTTEEAKAQEKAAKEIKRLLRTKPGPTRSPMP